MIAQKYRFHGLGSLRFAYGKGQTVRTQQLAIKYALNQRRSCFRVAVVVSKKVNKTAVVRNKIRRKLYEAMRSQQPHIVKPYDIIITVFSEVVAEIPQSELEKTLKTLLEKTGIISSR